MKVLRDIGNGLVDGAYWIKDHTLGILVVLLFLSLAVTTFAYIMAFIATVRGN